MLSASTRRALYSTSSQVINQRMSSVAIVNNKINNRQYSSMIDNAFGWFRSSKGSKKATKTSVESSANLIKEIESGKELESTEDKKDSTVAEKTEGNIKLNLNEIEFIGTTGKKQFEEQQRKKQLLSKVQFNQWWSTEKVENLTKFEEILSSINNSLKQNLNEPFLDLQTKFVFAKQLQKETGYMLSDYDITRFSTPKDFQTYFESKIFSGELAKYNERLPNAIYLDIIENGGSIENTNNNVYLSPNVPKHEQKKTFNKINNEANFLKKKLNAN